MTGRIRGRNGFVTLLAAENEGRVERTLLRSGPGSYGVLALLASVDPNFSEAPQAEGPRTPAFRDVR